MIPALLLITALWLGTGAAAVLLGLARRAQAETGLALLTRAARVARGAGGLLVVGGLARVGALAWAMAEDEPFAPMLGAVARETQAGRLSVALAATGVVLLAVPRRLLPVAVALAMVITAGLLAASGHAAELTPPAQWIGLDMVHGLAVSAWLGTLAILLPVLRRAEGARVLAGFAPVALIGAALTVATGAARSWQMAPAPAVLLSAPWGRWLAGKLGLVALIVLLGWRNWRAHRHRASLDGATADRLARRATLEVALASAVLVATAALTTTAPPDPAGP